MCNIWKIKPRADLTPVQIEQILFDKLFHRIESAGITGGEPTLRRDLIEVFEAVLASLPSLKSICLTSHGFHTKRIMEMCPKIIEKCHKKGVGFEVSISLDGLGKTHDIIRGIPGAYERTSRTIYELQNLQKETGIGLSVGVTFSQPNYTQAYDILAWCIEENIDFKFRTATWIERLENQDCADYFVSDKKGAEFLAGFFEHIAGLDIVSTTKSSYYESLAKMLSDGQQRKARCKAAFDNVVLDANGDLYYCTVFGDKLGNALERPASDIFFNRKNLAKRKYMVKNHCPKCLHDYAVRLPLRFCVVKKTHDE